MTETQHPLPPGWRSCTCGEAIWYHPSLGVWIHHDSRSIWCDETKTAKAGPA